MINRSASGSNASLTVSRLGKTRSVVPVVVIIGAQPGAGKTQLEDLAQKELGGNVVNCNADLFRDFHPRGEEIKHKFEAYYPELTSGYAQG